MVVSTNNQIYNAIIISLILGIILTIIVLVITFEKPEPFDEIYYSAPDKLPEHIYLNNDYDFSFTAHSLRNETKEYSYETKAVLYSMQDITYGNYNCVTRYKEKIPLKWENGTVLPAEVGSIVFGDPDVKVIEPYKTVSLENLEREFIDWDGYTIEFDYAIQHGLGDFTIYFYSDNKVKYALVFSHLKNKVYFIKGENNKYAIVHKPYNLSSYGGSVKLQISNSNLEVFVGSDKVLKIKSIFNYKKGQIGFAMRNMVAQVREATAYKGAAFNPKNSASFKQYSFDDKIIQKKANELLDRKVDYLTLTTVINKTKDWYGHIAKLKKFSYEEKESEIDSKILSEPEDYINWSHYTLEFDYGSIEGEGQLALIFRNKNKVKYITLINMPTRELFFVNFYDDKAVILKENIEIEDRNKVSINFTNEEVRVKHNSDVISSKKIRDYSKGYIEFEMKHAMFFIENLKVTNSDIKSGPFVFEKYLKKYKIEGMPPFYMGGDDRLEVRSRDITPFSGVISEQQEVVEEDGGFIEIEGDKVKKSDINLFIPNQLLEFNGINSRINNLTNYTFSFDYKLLEGLKKLKASFYSDNGEIHSLVLSETLKQTEFVFGRKNYNITHNKEFGFEPNEKYRISFKYENNSLDVTINYTTKLYHIKNINMENGYFALESINTYADFKGVILSTEDDQKRFLVEEDPCQLNKIGEVIIDKGKFTLDANENKPIQQVLNIRQPFDYALVSTMVDDLEIHFWVTYT